MAWLHLEEDVVFEFFASERLGTSNEPIPSIPESITQYHALYRYLRHLLLMEHSPEYARRFETHLH